MPIIQTTRYSTPHVMDFAQAVRDLVLGHSPLMHLQGFVPHDQDDMPYWNTVIRFMAGAYTHGNFDQKHFVLDGGMLGTHGTQPFGCVGCGHTRQVTFVPQLMLCPRCQELELSSPQTGQALYIVGTRLAAIQDTWRDGEDETVRIVQQPKLTDLDAPMQVTFRTKDESSGFDPEAPLHQGVFVYEGDEVIGLVHKYSDPWGSFYTTFRCPQQDFVTMNWTDYVQPGECDPEDILDIVADRLLTLAFG